MSFRIDFNEPGDFEAVHAAEAWCEEKGISVGSMERGEPRGLLIGDYIISKWHNMDQEDIDDLDGRMHGGRYGGVFIELTDEAANKLGLIP